MPEWLEDFIVAVGGGTVVLVGILTIFKNLFLKLFETGIDASFEKSLEKYRTQMSRSSRAYEIILDREMRFYEKMEPLFAELVPLVHDLLYCLKRNENVDRENTCDVFREHFGRYTELIKTLKNETLIHQSYIPDYVFLSATELVMQMQDDVGYWFSTAKLLFAGEYNKVDYNKGKETVDSLLMKLAVAELAIKKRLEELSKLS